MTHSDGILDDPIRLLRDAEWLRRIAGGLCSDAALADDLSQEALLLAWRDPSRVRGPLRPWLAGVVRRLAANRQRARIRRQRREAAAGPASAAPATDEVVARAAMHQSVVQAVMALDEPYRTAVLLRYFDDLPVGAVAQQLGVPVETARTRIKRAVGMLRVRLDAEHGDRRAWLVPLSAMTEWTVTSAGVGVGALTGVVLVMMQTKLVVPLLVVLGVGALWWWSGGASVPLTDPTGEPSAATTPMRTGTASMVVEDADPTPADTIQRSAVDADAIGLRGRVVDDAERIGIADALVRLLPGEAFDAIDFDAGFEAVEAVLGTVSPIGIATTDADGRFTLPTSAAQRFAVWITAKDRCSVLSQARQLEGGARGPGEVRLFPAVDLHGRVVDTDGEPVEALRLQASWRGTPNDDSDWIDLADYGGEVVTDADGRFAIRGSLRAGTYWFRIDTEGVEHARASLAFREVTAEAADVLVVVDVGLGQIAGIVVDEDGVALAGAPVTTTDGHGYAKTDDAGRFVLDRRRGCPREVGLRVWRERFTRSEELLATPAEWAWGRDDVRLVVPRGEDVVLQVVRAPSLAPVERFALDMQRADAATWGPGVVGQPDGTALHPGGRIGLPGLIAGRYRALVVEAERSTVVSFDVVAGGRGEQRLVLPELRPVVVQVVDREGAPVADSDVALLREPEQLPHHIFELGERRSARGEPTLPFEGAFQSVTTALTDVQGLARIEVPAVAPDTLLLRVTGPEHAPQVLAGTSWVGTSTVRVVVGRGSRLVGRLGPEAALRALIEPAFCLQSVTDPRMVFPRRFSAASRGREVGWLTADGSFELKGVPPGDWQVLVTYSVRGRNGSSWPQLVPLEILRDLRDGEVRKLDIDVGSVAPAAVRGLALLDGRPATWARLDLFGEPVAGQPGIGVFDCDADGRFEGTIAPGRYRVEATVLDRDTGIEIPCSYPGQVVVTAGATSQWTLDLRRGD